MTATRVTLAAPINRAECLELLQFQSYVGRIGFVTGGRPMVLPVNYLAEDTYLVICTAAGNVLGDALGSEVAFEVDGYSPLYHSGWSVVVRGRAEAITDPAAIERLHRGSLKSWAAPGPQLWIRVSIEEITGRRLG